LALRIEPDRLKAELQTLVLIRVAIERRESRMARKIKNPAPEECAGFVEALWNPSGSLAVFLRGASRPKSPRLHINFASFITEPSKSCQAIGLCSRKIYHVFL